MYCSKCGSPNANDARFCSACGQAMGAAALATNPGANPPPPPPAGSQPFTTSAAPGQQPAYYTSPGQPAAVQPVPPPPAYYASPPQQMGVQARQPVYEDPRMRSGVGVPGVPGGKQYAVGKSPGLAVFLSFLIPGVGQFYCGANGKGGIMLAVYLVSWILMGAYIGFVTITGVWIWSMVDAYNVASGKTPLS